MDFISAALPLPQRVPGYHLALQQYFSYLSPDVRIHVDVAEPELFAASLQPFSIGNLRGGIHRCNSPHHIHVPHTSLRAVDLYVILGGELSLFGPAGCTRLQAGDMVLWPTGMEWQAVSGQFEMIGLGLPEALLHHRYVDLRRVAGYKIATSSALARCVTALLWKAAECHHEFTSEEGAVLEKAILDTVHLLGSPRYASDARLTTCEELDRLERLKALAVLLLDSPDLSPTSLARRAGVSVRTVHRLFATTGMTFQEWLRESRLQRCLVELTDTRRRGSTIAAVAFSCGFNDLSTFNRAFRARFGVTPRQARQNSRVADN